MRKHQIVAYRIVSANPEGSDAGGGYIVGTMNPTMASTVSSARRHSFGTWDSRGTVAARCAPRDNTGSEGRPHFKTGTTKVSLLFLPGKARQGKSYNTADATMVRRHSSCRYSRQQALSIHVSAGYSKPPAFSRADYCLYQCRLGCWWIVDVKYCVRAFLPACLRWAAGVFRVALPRAAKDEADQAMSTPSLRFAQVG